jgi:hypothetical protein
MCFQEQVIHSAQHRRLAKVTGVGLKNPQDGSGSLQGERLDASGFVTYRWAPDLTRVSMRLRVLLTLLLLLCLGQPAQAAAGSAAAGAAAPDVFPLALRHRQQIDRQLLLQAVRLAPPLPSARPLPPDGTPPTGCARQPADPVLLHQVMRLQV